MKEIVNMKPTAYLTLAIWAGVLGAMSYGMLVVSHDARVEFGSLLFGESSHTKIVSPTSERAQFATIPQEDKDRLTAGLESLKTTLSSYALNLQTAEAASGSTK